MAFLTGGLDSRAVVAALRNHGMEVNSLNFAPGRSMDLVLGAQAASALGTDHFEFPLSAAPVSGKIAAATFRWRENLTARGHHADRPNLVWSGDGGSVALGHVYLSETLLDAAEATGAEATLPQLVATNMWGVPKVVLRARQADSVLDYPRLGLAEELLNLVHPDVGRRLHLLLLVTTQRGLLHAHYEQIYVHACELQLPFFDRAFLQSIVRLPARPFLAHRFYSKWLELFPPEVTAVPWQAYPGHESCPVPIPEGLSYQWDAQPREKALEERRRLCGLVARSLAGDRLNKRLLNRAKVALACCATFSGIRDYGYALSFARDLAIPIRN